MERMTTAEREAWEYQQRVKVERAASPVVTPRRWRRLPAWLRSSLAVACILAICVGTYFVVDDAIFAESRQAAFEADAARWAGEMQRIQSMSATRLLRREALGQTLRNPERVDGWPAAGWSLIGVGVVGGAGLVLTGRRAE